MFELINRILKECKRQNIDKHIVIRLDAMYVWLLSIIFQIIYMILLVFTSNVYNKILLLLFQYSINAILSGDEWFTVLMSLQPTIPNTNFSYHGYAVWQYHRMLHAIKN